MEPDVKAELVREGIPFTETSRLDEALPELDALYVTRMQTEWDTAGESLAMDYRQFGINPGNVGRLKRDAVIMHPLPRGPEMDPAVDNDPRAMYWRQERNGMWMRVAILLKIFRLEDRIFSLAPGALPDGPDPA
jgi:aspartate carbamoyltransferase catalytic subunit